MTDAESILAAINSDFDWYFDPTRTQVFDTATLAFISASPLWFLMDDAANIVVAESSRVKPQSFDDVWGAAIEQANITEESLAAFDTMDPQDELLNLLSKLRD